MGNTDRGLHRRIKKARASIRFQYAKLAAHKLTEMGHPTRLDEGYSVICAKIRLVCPELVGTDRTETLGRFVGEGDQAARLRAEYNASRKTMKAEKKKRKAEGVNFYESEGWRRLRYKALVLHGGACQCCGATRHDGVKLHVDHIKPRSLFPALELDLANLQVLCEDCNLGKSNKDATDWRPAEFAA